MKGITRMAILADIGIDFGTFKTILLSGSKIILEQPSVVAVDSETWEPICYGEEAYQMIGRTPDSVTVVNPVERGVISDYVIAEKMLKFYMEKAFGNRVIKPRVMISVPIGVTSVQHRSVANSIETAGARSACTIESPIAAAIGLGVDFATPRGNMIIDIGAGITDVAVISMGAFAESCSFRTASFDFDDAIIKYVRRKFKVLIGKPTASRIKEQIGCVIKRPIFLTMKVKGQNAFTGLPQFFEITSDDVYKALKDVASSLCSQIISVIEKTEPDLVADILTYGVHLTGGGSQIFGMDKLLEKKLKVKIIKDIDPVHTVALGAGIALKKPDLLKNGDYQFRSIQELIFE